MLFFPPLLTAKEERSFSVSWLSHSGHSIRAGEPKTIFSNRCPHFRHEYSKIGIPCIIANFSGIQLIQIFSSVGRRAKIQASCPLSLSPSST